MKRDNINYWRMSFKEHTYNKDGDKRTIEMWQACKERGIAVLDYWVSGKSIVGDCSKLSEDEYNKIWREKWPNPNPGSGRASLKYLIYQMKRGDIIYVKQGPEIVGKGKIIKEHQYDPNVLKGAKVAWSHFVTVKWEDDFTKFKCRTIPAIATIIKLEGNNLDKIKKCDSHALYINEKQVKAAEAKEGRRYKAEITFRMRNRALIAAKKDNSDYRCEVCGASYEENYGTIGKGFIIAHHNKTIGGRKRASKTTLNDIALVCANCHDMLHTKKPPISISRLHKIFEENKQS